jgi:hypothetical protein
MCNMLPALRSVGELLGYPGIGTETFTGPVPGSTAEPDLLHRGC